MSTDKQYTEIEELIATLEKAAPKSCAKPKSEMCSKCIDRVFSPKALMIQEYLNQLKTLNNQQEILPTALKTVVVELLSSE
jgi:hypothetical protein